MMYKAINTQTSEHISNMFSKSIDTHGKNLRSADRDMVKVPYARTQYYENSFRIDVPSIGKFGIRFKHTHDFINWIIQEIFIGVPS